MLGPHFTWPKPGQLLGGWAGRGPGEGLPEGPPGEGEWAVAHPGRGLLHHHFADELSLGWRAPGKSLKQLCCPQGLCPTCHTFGSI